ncbi:hypothetical protein C0989_007268 [Termitomyces sp. Mn162]|nr:hypothetical protein C0989_007268 [Termitomyces sp. Mn162]
MVVNKLSKDVSTRDTISTGNILKQKSETAQPISEDIPSSKAVPADPSDGFITFNNPFSDVSAPVKISSSPSLALYPFVRRMSLPRHRSSFCIPASNSRAVTSLRQHATVHRHGSLAEDNESYPSSPHVPSGKVRIYADDDEKEARAECTLPVSLSKSTAKNPLAPDTSRKLTNLKRITKRVRKLLRHPHRS